MTSFLGLAIKLTGSCSKYKETVAFLNIIQNIADSMAQGNNWKKSDKFAHLNKMYADLTNITGGF